MTREDKYCVVVVDDHPLFRRGVVQLLKMDPLFENIHEAGNFDEALRSVREAEPDLVLLDLNMKGTGGIQILSAIKEFDPSIKVVILTVSDAPADVIQCLRNGADGFLLKDQEPEDILANIKNAMEGENVLSPSLTHALAQSLKEVPTLAKRDLASLTERESIVLKLISQGKSNKLIARELDISEGTIKVHVKHVLRKLSFHSRVEAAVWYSETTR